VDYCAFWLKKYGEEYKEGGVVEQGKDVETGGEEEGQQSEGERIQRSWGHQDPWLKK
jgi:hypothetical protein